MYLNLKNFNNIPELREPDRKKTPYTITIIGGPADLVAWKANQELLAEARDSYLKPIREASRLRAIAGVESQSLEPEYDKAAKDEINYRTEVRPGITSKVGSITSKVVNHAAPLDSPSVLTRLNYWCAKLWKNAFDNT